MELARERLRDIMIIIADADQTSSGNRCTLAGRKLETAGATAPRWYLERLLEERSSLIQEILAGLGLKPVAPPPPQPPPPPPPPPPSAQSKQPTVRLLPPSVTTACASSSWSSTTMTRVHEIEHGNGDATEKRRRLLQPTSPPCAARPCRNESIVDETAFSWEQWSGLDGVLPLERTPPVLLPPPPKTATPNPTRVAMGSQVNPQIPDVAMIFSVEPPAARDFDGHCGRSALPPASSLSSSGGGGGGGAWSRHSLAAAVSAAAGGLTKQPLRDSQAVQHEEQQSPLSNARQQRSGACSDSSCITTTMAVQEDSSFSTPTKITTSKPMSYGIANGFGNAGGLPALRDDGDRWIAPSWAEVKQTGAKKLAAAAAAAAASGRIDRDPQLAKQSSNPAISIGPADSSREPNSNETGQRERPVQGCRDMGCRRRPLYAFKGARKAVRCPLHRLQDMVNVRHPLCQNESCFRQPSFGVEGDQRASFCSEHRLPDMVNVSSRRCRAPQCLRHPNFGHPGDRRASYCCGHKAPGMVDVVSRRCQRPQCMRRPLYAMTGQRASFCSAHKDPGMVDVVSSRCQYEEGCNRHPSFGWKKIDGKARRCAHHRLEGMESVKVHRRTNPKAHP